MGTSVTLLVRASKNSDGSVTHNNIAVAFSVELTKLILACIYYFLCTERNKSVQYKLHEFLSKWSLMRLFIIPAGLYCIFNGLQYVNMTLVTPATYRVLINSKVLFSGGLLQLFFAVYLSNRQWVGLLLLVIACCIEQFGSFDYTLGMIPLVSICTQAFCSSLAGVYFQWLLQRDSNNKTSSSSDVSIWEKNIMLYIWSCILNTIYLLIIEPDIVIHPILQYNTFNIYIKLAIICAALGGFSTSLILRYMDVIVKEYANFVEMFAIMCGQYMLFNVDMKSTLLIAVIICSISLYLYNVPATNSSSSTTNQSISDSKQSVLDDAEKQATVNSIAMTILNNDSDDESNDRRKLIPTRGIAT